MRASGGIYKHSQEQRLRSHASRRRCSPCSNTSSLLSLQKEETGTIKQRTAEVWVRHHGAFRVWTHLSLASSTNCSASEKLSTWSPFGRGWTAKFTATLKILATVTVVTNRAQGPMAVQWCDVPNRTHHSDPLEGSTVWGAASAAWDSWGSVRGKTHLGAYSTVPGTLPAWADCSVGAYIKATNADKLMMCLQFLGRLPKRTRNIHLQCHQLMLSQRGDLGEKHFNMTDQWGQTPWPQNQWAKQYSFIITGMTSSVTHRADLGQQRLLCLTEESFALDGCYGLWV